ncbi:hypothetical protein ACI3K4_27905 [Streptomyces sp. CSMPJR101]|uniref:hypothetical protein n=1 Tax=Streptomyces sp. CSMPJR101 TaxID=1279378 RepID=UPI0038553789
MLDVAYIATTDLPTGRLAQIDEDRGSIRIRVDKNALLPDVIRKLNAEMDHFLATSQWFQLWKDEIVSRASPGCSLRIVYRLDPRAPGLDIGVGERRGLIIVYIPPALDTEQFAALMNPVSKQFLAGGRWFQLYAGEIIDNSPEPMSRV